MQQQLLADDVSPDCSRFVHLFRAVRGSLGARRWLVTCSYANGDLLPALEGNNRVNSWACPFMNWSLINTDVKLWFMMYLEMLQQLSLDSEISCWRRITNENSFTMELLFVVSQPLMEVLPWLSSALKPWNAKICHMHGTICHWPWLKFG